MGLAAVFFDLGGTIAHDRKIPNLKEECLRNVAKVLQSKGYVVDDDDVIKTYDMVFGKAYEESNRTLNEVDLFEVYSEILSELNIQPSKELVNECIKAYYDKRRRIVMFYPDAKEAIINVRKMGLKTAVVSNANLGFEIAVEELQLDKYFDALIASYKVGKKKPHPKIFNEALNRLNVTPDEVVMVGDSLHADVYGAKKVGITAVWIFRNDKTKAEEIIATAGIKPDYIIRNMYELLDIIKHLI